MPDIFYFSKIAASAAFNIFLRVNAAVGEVVAGGGSSCTISKHYALCWASKLRRALDSSSCLNFRTFAAIFNL